MAEPTAKPGTQLAGLVLALLGAFTYGATSAFGLVLCAEWLLDPRRPAHLRRWDAVGAVLAVPGVLFFAWLSVAMFDYKPGGKPMGVLIAAYWAAFAWWLTVRYRTRWRHLRRSPEPPDEELQW
ncbi:hypothetical protein [Gemmata sp.]|uniref:hypothetical protein n=1 Tax=Gemmata sp. TaxID=1914242 RepID=UPI003F717C99